MSIIEEAYRALWPDGHPWPASGDCIEVPDGIAVLVGGYLEALYVRPCSRNAGIARQLVECVKEKARSRGILRITADTWSDERSAEGVLRALGFEADAPRDGIDVALAMVLPWPR